MAEDLQLYLQMFRFSHAHEIWLRTPSFIENGKWQVKSVAIELIS